MAQELAFALINPYIIAKSRTGGVIARFMNRTRLNLVAARMFGPSRELAESYADLVLTKNDKHPGLNRMMADYIRRWYAPDPATGRPHRVMLLLFTGDNAIERVHAVAGTPRPDWSSGETVRDTYGDYVTADDGRPLHFEPAVFIAPTAVHAAATLKLWGRYSETDGGLLDGGIDVPADSGVQTTLVLLKPDNFRAASLRIGNIVDLFSRSGLKIVAIRILRMSREQAQEFYGPVRDALRRRSGAEIAGPLDSVISNAYGVTVADPLRQSLIDELGNRLGDVRFDRLLDYITGADHNASTNAGGENCFALVYQGVSAIRKIRHLLGSTDPRTAEPGSVRYEFGSDVMANAAHASDTPKSAIRELGIIDMQCDTLRPWIEGYYGPIEHAADADDFRGTGI